MRICLRAFCLLFVLIAPARPAFAQDWKGRWIAGLGNGGAYVEDESGHVILAHREQDSFVPASSIKIATAALALKTLGSDYRFITEFYVDSEDRLVIKGYGNPMLLSQELVAIAKDLIRRGLKTCNGIVLDASFFDSHIQIDGVERSLNPYDAVNAALLANFNTISVQKLKNGSVISGESQTPITAAALARAKPLRPGRHRVNLGSDSEVAVRYVGELMQAFLKQGGAAVRGGVTMGRVPEGAKLALRHESSESLEEVLKSMLKFSTNLTANQLFLIVGAKKYGAPATVEKGVAAMEDFLKNEVGWKTVRVAEGSGLSRRTHVTAIQMTKLLRHVEKYLMDLLPLRDDVFRAKTGTLKGVSTYAGFFPLPDGSTARFVILMNDPHGPQGQKFRLSKSLYAHIHGLPEPVTR